MTNATLSPQISISSAMLTRDVALQILHNNDLGAGNPVTLRLRHIADHWTLLGLPPQDVLSAILLPLNELIRVRDCSPQWGARRPEADRGSCHDGSSDYQQLTAYARLAQQAMAEISTAEPTKLPTFCETGFNAGHTAMTFLMLGYRVHSFDVAKNAYTPACARMLSQIWPDRFTLHVGDSRITIDAWVPPPATCDVVSVDGLHTQAAVLADVRAFAEHARAHAMLLVDDTSPSYGPNLMAAWQLLVDGGEVAPRHCTFLGVVATIRGPRPKHYCEGRLVAQPVPNASQLRCPAPPAPISSCERVTVVVMSYAGGRLDTLVVTLRHYANAPVVQEVVLVWNKGKAPRRVRALALRLAPRLRIVEFTTNRLMNRFHPSIRPASTAVMLADDDLLVPPATIAGGLQVWCRNQAALAGLAARHFEGDATSPGGYRYGRGHCDPTPHAPTLWQRVRQLWQPSPFLHMVLPTGMFIHAGWFCHLWSAELRHIRRDMDSACDDMLVNFAVGARTRQPHVWYGGQPGIERPERVSKIAGLSANATQWVARRTQCVSYFVKAFGGFVPLQGSCPGMVP